MASSLSNLVNILSERIHKIKCKYKHDDKKRETCGIKYKYCDCFSEYMNFKNDLIEYKCLCCNKNYKHKFDKKLEERFFITLKFSNHDNNNIINNNNNIIILIYPYEYMDDWKKFNETSLPEKKNF